MNNKVFASYVQVKVVERNLTKPSKLIQTSRKLRVVSEYSVKPVTPKPVAKPVAPPVTVYHVDPKELGKIVPLDKPITRKEINESPEPKGKAANLPACVYWITDGTAVKIGYTTNLNHRLATLQTGNPRELEVLKIKQFATAREAYEYEQHQHKLNNSIRVRGEWFKLH